MTNRKPSYGQNHQGTSASCTGPVRQRGMTLIGFIIVLAIGVFVAYIGMKIIPIYIDYYSVRQAMTSLQEEPGVENMSPARIRDLFFRKLYVSYVDDVKPENVTVLRQGGLRFRVAYEVREDVLGNMDVVATFDDTVPLTKPQ